MNYALGVISGILLIHSSATGALAQQRGTGRPDTTLPRPAYASDAGPRVWFDTTHWNPSISEGRYHGVANLLRADGYRILPTRIAFDALPREPYDILLVVTPYASDPATDRAGAARPVFTDTESDSLQAWVRRGGRLLLVAGHEPSGAALANLAQRFGLELRNGTAMDADSTNTWAGCPGCLKFTRANGLLRAHPITVGRDSSERLDAVISAVGQSLRGPPGSHPLLALGPTAFDVVASGDTIPARGRAQALALSFGSGRLVVIGDGSILTGFTYGPENPRFRRWWPQDPNNRQFTLNVMHWLTGLLSALPDH